MRIYVSKFRILLSEKDFWTKVIMYPDFDIFTASQTWYASWASLIQFWDDDVTTWHLNFKISRKKFHKRIPHLKVPFTFDFNLSITISAWNTNLDLFELFLVLMTSSRGVKTSKFWGSGVKNEYFASNFPLLLTFILLSLLLHEMQV